MMMSVDPAQFAMAIYVTVLSAVLMAVVIRSASGVRVELKAEIAQLRVEVKQAIADLRAEFKQDLGDLRTELKQDIAEPGEDIAQIRSEMAIMRSDLTQVALAVGTPPRAASDDR